jgi:DNA-binding NtrC family response regulator
MQKERVVQLIDFNLNVIKLMLNNDSIQLSEKAKEKIVQKAFVEGAEDDILTETELELVLESAAKKCRNNLIEPDDVLFKEDHLNNLAIPVGLKLEDLERKYILQTLYFAEQNRTKAADILGISIRTLRNKINQYRLEGFL